MNGEEALNKDGAHEIISALENAVKVIVKWNRFIGQLSYQIDRQVEDKQ